MPKYRLLNSDELKELEKEFIDFLVVNGIDANEWQSIQKEKPEDVDRILELFSDVVFEKILRQTKYLVYQSGTDLYVFNYAEDKASLLIGQFQDIETLQSSDENAIMDFVRANEIKMNISYQEKEYVQGREEEIFKMIQSSCQIMGEQLYSLLLTIYEKNN